MKKKILIIEDEKELINGLKLNLVFEGYDVIWALDGEEGLNKALKETPDLILLDIMLPKKDGLDVCRELRGQNATIPIIMLTAKGEEVDKVVGLEIGADDYITKPFSVKKGRRKMSLQSIASMTSRLTSFISRLNGRKKNLTSLPLKLKF
jgi:DNA-binding response OmpR family regulator